MHKEYINAKCIARTPARLHRRANAKLNICVIPEKRKIV